MLSKRSRLTVVVAALGVLVAAAVIFSIAARPAAVASASDSGSYAVSAGLDDCGSGWGDGGSVPGGDQELTVTNPTVAGVEVYLQETVGGKVFLDLENLGAGVHAKAHVTLGSGRYRFVCLPADADPVRGPTVTVGRAPASAQLTPGVVPVTRADLIPVALAYGKWVGTRLPVLQQQVAALSADAEEGDLSAAKRDWLAAHTTYETLGAAYDAFGDVGDQIDGLPRGGLTGFHLVESQLWGGAAASAVAASAAQLNAEVGSLAGTFADAEIDPGAIALRAHEIVEGTIQDVLTGAADAGSGTELATIDANLEGAAQALAPLHDLLASRYADLDRATKALQDSQSLVASFRGADGSGAPLAALDRAQRERLDAALDQDAELLAPVAAICDPRRES